MAEKSLETALRMLVRKNYHSLELAKKLKEKGIGAEEIPSVLERLKRDGYLDDPAWESAFVESFIKKGRGAAVLGNYLHAKGLLSLLPRLKSRVEKGEKTGLEAQIKKFKGDLDDPKEKQKLFQRLQRKGFNIEQILGML